jgi:hypothetical protein
MHLVAESEEHYVPVLIWQFEVYSLYSVRQEAGYKLFTYNSLMPMLRESGYIRALSEVESHSG